MIEAMNSGCVEFAEAEQQVKRRLLLDVAVGQELRPLLPLPRVGPAVRGVRAAVVLV
jgi:hypothetical protein